MVVHRLEGEDRIREITNSLSSVKKPRTGTTRGGCRHNGKTAEEKEGLVEKGECLGGEHITVGRHSRD